MNALLTHLGYILLTITTFVNALRIFDNLSLSTYGIVDVKSEPTNL